MIPSGLQWPAPMVTPWKSVIFMTQNRTSSHHNPGRMSDKKTRAYLRIVFDFRAGEKLVQAGDRPGGIVKPVLE